jgi:hypothetical protein
MPCASPFRIQGEHFNGKTVLSSGTCHLPPIDERLSFILEFFGCTIYKTNHLHKSVSDKIVPPFKSRSKPAQAIFIEPEGGAYRFKI